MEPNPQARDAQSKAERIAERRDHIEDNPEDLPGDDVFEYAAMLEISLFQYARMVVMHRGTQEEYEQLIEASREGRLLEFAMGDE